MKLPDFNFSIIWAPGINVEGHGLEVQPFWDVEEMQNMLSSMNSIKESVGEVCHSCLHTDLRSGIWIPASFQTTEKEAHEL